MDKVKPPKVREEPLDPIAMPDLKELFATCRWRTFTGDRDRAMLLALLGSGCRAKEFLSLAIEDVNLHTGIEKAREVQRQHFAGMMGVAKGNLPLLCNADVGPAEVRKYCRLDDSDKSLLRAAMWQLGMSARAFHRILKLARTIADLEEGAPEIKMHYLAKTIQYRPRKQG